LTIPPRSSSSPLLLLPSSPPYQKPLVCLVCRYTVEPPSIQFVSAHIFVASPLLLLTIFVVEASSQTAHSRSHASVATNTFSDQEPPSYFVINTVPNYLPLLVPRSRLIFWDFVQEPLQTFSVDTFRNIHRPSKTRAQHIHLTKHIHNAFVQEHFSRRGRGLRRYRPGRLRYRPEYCPSVRKEGLVQGPDVHVPRHLPRGLDQACRGERV
ncbi:hypothetical protein CI238_07902, partial [Colletotrichum incanum]